ncbi:MAG: hypothetical protein GH151_00570 [Bacteroidetes bacterium]|nr:hypothetical protein [Bacteroidota bacterium]
MLIFKLLIIKNKAINENAISAMLKHLGQTGARKLKILLLSKNARWLHESGLESITLDADSTVKSVCGNQQGAAKGFNTTSKGAKSYHPLLVFVSEMKLLYHSWFRTGSAYTANGIVDFLKETAGILATSLGLENLPEKYKTGIDETTKFSFTAYDFLSLIEVCETLTKQMETDVRQGDTLKMKMAPGGGFTAFLVPI